MIGFSEGFHDSAVAVVHEDRIIFATHGERYSKKKHDKYLCDEAAFMAEALNTYDGVYAFYEKPFPKRMRQFFAGQKHWNKPRELRFRPTVDFTHHLSHAAAAFQTSVFEQAACVVVDSIGEFDCSSVWVANMIDGRAKYTKVWSKKYPKSIGLWYSALTKYAGLRPLDEEYIFMGMAAFGENKHENQLRQLLTENNHRGINIDFSNSTFDLAKSAQVVLEEELTKIFKIALEYSNNVCYGGGVALNCVANTKLREMCNLWIMPNPGDAGAALGAALLVSGKKVQWTPYCGHNIERKVDPKDVVQCLLENGVVGVANGRAEYGPRALGNRSLLADPRKAENKEKVNRIKKRREFRPFAPAILEEHCRDYFDMNHSHSRYMSYVYNCLRPEEIPAAVHVDNSARVQTVPETSSSILRPILEEWYRVTGCPVLLNTSLNIRGKPMVNDWGDALDFQAKYNVKVF
tara:strand:+ start:412 stop:1797 length:1386 start_codon:yes stop_codon:yes gene_type:complete